MLVNPGCVQFLFSLDQQLKNLKKCFLAKSSLQIELFSKLNYEEECSSSETTENDQNTLVV